MLIQSKDNSIFKKYRHLSISKTSKNSDLFLIEGIREISLALISEVQIDSIALRQGDGHNDLEDFIKNVPMVYIFNKDLFMRLAVRKSGSNALAIAKKPSHNIGQRYTPSIVLVLENIEKPGNLGAIARSADALGVTDIIVTGNSVDIYNPNVIRSSLGAVFAINIYTMNNDDCLKYLSQHGYNIIATDLSATLDYRKANYLGKIAIVMGSEAHGISQFWLQVADQKVIIPMLGQVNSLNLSVSSAIMISLALSRHGL